MTSSPRFLLPLLFALGCAHAPAAVALPAPPGPRAESDSAAVQAVRALLESQVAAWNRGDLEGYMAGYWRSPELTFFAGGAVTTGWDQTLARYRRRYQGEGRAMGTLTFEGLQIELLGDGAALARGRWVLRFPPPPASSPAGAPAPDKQAAGLFTVIVRRRPEGWRVVHDHSCAD
jgi:beta-aspartyl-peptidase (threonine type)